MAADNGRRRERRSPASIATGARRGNDANVLALRARPAVAVECARAVLVAREVDAGGLPAIGELKGYDPLRPPPGGAAPPPPPWSGGPR